MKSEIVNHSSTCCNIVKYKCKQGLLDDCLDATYITHVENNGQLEHIKKQLKEYQPTRKVYIAYIRGHLDDSREVFLKCFKHADDKGYNNVLILEDNFVFDREIKNKKNTDSISRFIKSREKKGESFIYYLGCKPSSIFLYSLFELYHFRSHVSFSSHSVIYSKKARQTSFDKRHEWWDYNLNVCVPQRYLFHIPLCYQDIEKDILSRILNNLVGIKAFYWHAKINACFFMVLIVMLIYSVVTLLLTKNKSNLFKSQFNQFVYLTTVMFFLNELCMWFYLYPF